MEMIHNQEILNNVKEQAIKDIENTKCRPGSRKPD